MEQHTLKTPPVEYRSFLFWAWDDDLHEAELLRQIKAFHDQHLGGFFMHSRDGLETPYLGSSWDACIKACTKEAHQLGMQAWLYDEDRFPSGTCGGTVTAQEDCRYALHGLTMEVRTDICESDSSIVALYLAQVDGDVIMSCERIEQMPEVVEPGKSLLVARNEQSRGSVWFNGSAPPDNLDPQCVQAFIESTYAHYGRLLEEEIAAGTVPGVFTDEPSLSDRHSAFDPHRGWIPWSGGMDEFRDSLGYPSIFESLPYIYFDGIHSKTARHDYWRTIALRYEQCYSQQIGLWCAEHGLQFTGHYLQEDKLGLCTRVNGSVMPHYTHEQIPGVDLLCERTDEYLTVKQCSSVAHQYGKKRVMSETYAACGWDFSFEGMRWVGDWQYALGVTNRSQHLSLYSLKGSRKRDYPQSFNTHVTWWPKLHVVEDYFARLSYLLQQGEVYRPVLVIHPMSTVWTHMGCSPYGNPIRRLERDVPASDRYGYEFNDLLKTLCNHLIDVDLADETLLQRDGHVHGTSLVLGQAQYSAVVLPPMESLYGSTVQLLSEYVQAGGRLICMGSFPSLIEGRPDAAVVQLCTGSHVMHVADAQQLISAVKDSVVESVQWRTLSGSGALVSQLRIADDEWFLFLVNNDRNHPCCGNLKIGRGGVVSSINLLEGTETEIARSEAGVEFPLELAACESVMIHVGSSGNLRATMEPTEILSSIALDTPVGVSLDVPNVLVLDEAWYCMDDEPLSSEPLQVYQLQHAIRERLGMQQVDTDEIPQRYVWCNQPHPNDGHRVRLQFQFEVENTSCECKLAIEEPELFSIKCNGIHVSSAPHGYYLDHAFELVSLPQLQQGINIIDLECTYSQAMSLENIYLIGDFGVSPERTIVDQPKTLELGDWTYQGLLQYPGTVTYDFLFDWEGTGDGVRLEMGNWSGTVAAVHCNGHIFDIPWNSLHEIHLTQALQQGVNKIGIQVFGSPRNMLGPLHLACGKKVFTNPASFSPGKEEFTQAYQFVANGLMNPCTISVVTTKRGAEK